MQKLKPARTIPTLDDLDGQFEKVFKQLEEVNKNTEACLDACKEIAKATGELTASIELYRKSGKF